MRDEVGLKTKDIQCKLTAIRKLLTISYMPDMISNEELRRQVFVCYVNVDMLCHNTDQQLVEFVTSASCSLTAVEWRVMDLSEFIHTPSVTACIKVERTNDLNLFLACQVCLALAVAILKNELCVCELLDPVLKSYKCFFAYLSWSRFLRRSNTASALCLLLTLLSSSGPKSFMCFAAFTHLSHSRAFMKICCEWQAEPSVINLALQWIAEVLLLQPPALDKMLWTNLKMNSVFFFSLIPLNILFHSLLGETMELFPR